MPGLVTRTVENKGVHENFFQKFISFNCKSEIFRYHTLKYQVIVCISTGNPVHLVGPFLGKISDATMWKDSKVAEYLEKKKLWVVGDKGYQGNGYLFIFCLFIVHFLHSLHRLPSSEALSEEESGRRDTSSRKERIQQKHIEKKNSC